MSLQSHVCQNESERHTVYLSYQIGVRWGSTEQFGMATLWLFGGRSRPYIVAYLCGLCHIGGVRGGIGTSGGGGWWLINIVTNVTYLMSVMEWFVSDVILCEAVWEGKIWTNRTILLTCHQCHPFTYLVAVCCCVRNRWPGCTWCLTLEVSCMSLHLICTVSSR